MEDKIKVGKLKISQLKDFDDEELFVFWRHNGMQIKTLKDKKLKKLFKRDKKVIEKEFKIRKDNKQNDIKNKRNKQTR